jgi:hypothetical protein
MSEFKQLYLTASHQALNLKNMPLPNSQFLAMLGRSPCRANYCTLNNLDSSASKVLFFTSYMGKIYYNE